MVPDSVISMGKLRSYPRKKIEELHEFGNKFRYGVLLPKRVIVIILVIFYDECEDV